MRTMARAMQLHPSTMQRSLKSLPLLVALSMSAMLGCDDSKPSAAEATATASAAASADPQVELTKEARGLTKTFASALKDALMKGMGKGPAEAVKVCNTEAPAIAERVDGAEGWKVGRTSLKLRNPHNAPDAWEREQLERFEKDKAAGKPADQLEAAAIVDIDGTRTFRYMKAIPTAAMCLSCHGSELASDVESTLDELYPKDAARGFSDGDLRGAFTLQKAL